VAGWYPEMLKYQGRYEEARKNFQKYYKATRNKSTYFGKKAKHEMKACEFAKRLAEDSADIAVTNLGEGLNTYDSEFSPVFMDDSTIFFSSLRAEKIKKTNEVVDKQYLIRIFRGERNGGQWNATGEPPEVINAGEEHSANGSLSVDGNKYYFTRCSADFKCKLYVALKKGNTWQPAEPLVELINEVGSNTTQPFIAKVNNKEVLFFASDRRGSKGGLDIWYSIFTHKRNQFSRPKNLGKKINTPGNEITPFYDMKNDLLYFSSDWHYGLGGFDVFKAAGKLRPQAPENVGKPYNTSVNDFYYVHSPDHENGLLVSNRKGSFAKKGETCCNDIYAFEFPKEPEPPKMTLELLNKYLPVTLYFHNDQPDSNTTDTVTKMTYMQSYKKYTSRLPRYKQEYSIGLEGEAKTEAEADIEAFFDDRVDKGVRDLELFTELLLIELEKGQEIEMTVKGYASPLAKTDYNVKLTYRRIHSMINYMRKHDGGVYIPYIEADAQNGGSLEFVMIPFGEYSADQTISDNLQDKKNSVYSRHAAMERKIEIVSVHQAHKDSAVADMTFAKEIHDFGAVKPGEEVVYTFSFTNTGQKELIISSVSSECDCTVADWSKEPIPPGAPGQITVTYNSTGKTGKQVSSVVLHTNSKAGKKELTVTAEVLEN